MCSIFHCNLTILSGSRNTSPLFGFVCNYIYWRKFLIKFGSLVAANTIWTTQFPLPKISIEEILNFADLDLCTFITSHFVLTTCGKTYIICFKITKLGDIFWQQKILLSTWKISLNIISWYTIPPFPISCPSLICLQAKSLLHWPVLGKGNRSSWTHLKFMDGYFKHTFIFGNMHFYTRSMLLV